MSDVWVKERIAYYLKSEADVQMVFAKVFVEYFTSGEAERDYKRRFGVLYDEATKAHP